MHGPAMFRFTSICLPLAALALSSLTAVAAPAASKRVVAPPSLVQAYRAAEASLRRIPGDDIESDFRPVWTGVADLDGDGRSEVVYFYTSTYTGGSFAQSNVVAVMTALTANDPRGQENPKSLSRVDAEDFAAIRESGYGDDAGIQIPGAVQSIRIDGNRIIVAFTVTAGATVCEIPHDFRHVCPPDGNYTWTLRWTPGTLARIRK
ncbi:MULTISPECIES: hypothetical protein [Stenotrophomonas]|uniref:Uncharacterized protein n=1 Tax=Stenotrophomonas maltophilia TaxID=40324 RepID=A0AAD0FMK7_STEMA|nr:MULTISPECIES: hypothetical protein [Stenotrophomonas]AUI07865.1 hypothetical protein SmaCSM2_12005 [Stenotrophomonas maltophilia]EKU9975310.1 hypothetical protein [Stenotrophomonas maltophilia]KMU60548.1 hypothetical protein STRNTR1_3867 [Stenotrophomonas maltophilia]MBA2128219.1 hypothetical protein [Stenotrophomonas maltophilia]MBH1680474.1 hypothetical protein [Stenotrophomonas maltophilia]